MRKDWIKIALFFSVCIGLGVLTLVRLGYFKEKKSNVQEIEYVMPPFGNDSVDEMDKGNPQPIDSIGDSFEF